MTIRFLCGLVALAFALRQVAQLLLMCDRHDIGISIDSDGESENPAPSVTTPKLPPRLSATASPPFACTRSTRRRAPSTLAVT